MPSRRLAPVVAVLCHLVRRGGWTRGYVPPGWGHAASAGGGRDGCLATRTSWPVPVRASRDGDGGLSLSPPVAACWGGLPRTQRAVKGPGPAGGRREAASQHAPAVAVLR